MRDSDTAGDRRSVLLIGLAVASSLLGDVTIYTVLPVYHESLGLSPIEVGIILSANRWVRLLTNQFPRRIPDRHRPRNVLGVFLLAGAVISLAYATHPPFWLFLVARMAWGAAWSYIRHAGVLGSLRAAAGRGATRTVGVYNGTVQTGFIVGTIAGGALFDAFGFSVAFVVLAVVSLSGLVFDYLGFRGVSFGDEPEGVGRSPGLRDEAGPLLRSFVTSCVGVGLIVSTLGFALEQRFGATVEVGPLVIGVATLNAVLIALRYAVDGIGSPLVGTAVDRLGRRTAEILAFSVGTATLVAAAVLVASPLLVPLVIVFFVANVASRLSLISRAGVAGAASFSRMVTASDVGSASGPLIGWIAIDRAGSPDAVFAIGAALYAVATVSAAITPRARRS